MREIITLIQQRKLECLIAFIILLIAVGAGIYTNEVLEVGRNWIIRFYLGFTFVSLVLFSIYIGIERIFAGSRA
ncbi:hypothetical protein [Natribacillus halophilus]|uniref:Uncharacterized protein n=1 Tax=Natribacillus halophilus TaxID=549003 RepID=A0A1G8R2Z6_9BACI|nr:hypothetical protein [Natribacillus halophilus]SDJ11328.1 hypothetical protein SAMN04488123_11533 [Natribacillus halophilus]